MSGFVRGFWLMGALLFALAPSAASAQMPMPDTSTPTLYGGQTIPAGEMTLGASVGYPSLRFQVIWGISENFDVGIQPALTYGGGFGGGPGRGNHLTGYRQDVGLNLEVPLRWVLAENSGFNVGLRVVPYYMIGQGSPAFSVGGQVGARFGIPMPKIFTLFVGPEVGLGFASVGSDPNRTNGFDGEVLVVFGLEALYKDKWIFTNEWNAGGSFGSNGLNGHGILRVWFGFGVLL